MTEALLPHVERLLAHLGEPMQLLALASAALLMVVLHAVLLPVNLWRVWQMIGLTRRVAASSADGPQLQIWLRPYMRSHQYRAGEQVFVEGDEADRLYFLASGEVELPEVARVPQASLSATDRCRRDSTGQNGSASDGRAHELTAVQLTPKLRGQTRVLRGGLYPATNGCT